MKIRRPPITPSAIKIMRVRAGSSLLGSCDGGVNKTLAEVMADGLEKDDDRYREVAGWCKTAFIETLRAGQCESEIVHLTLTEPESIQITNSPARLRRSKGIDYELGYATIAKSTARNLYIRRLAHTRRRDPRLTGRSSIS